ncbi:MAG: GNAT family N-acetyltransferase [Burkholderiales bacterium]|nr:GNAT family N-acetyltransferase [Burkholderiales bacterium]
MSTSLKFTVRAASWQDDLAALQDLRHRVFIIEQQVPEALEWDEADAVSVHALALDAQQLPIGTGRLLPDGHIGRMAVVPQWRRRGVGSAILMLLIGCARQQGHAAVHLHAQTRAIGFYAQHGFVVHGNEFMDAGIPHRRMTLNW